MNITAILAEAAILAPNDVPQSDQLAALTAINQDFFNVVKIPKIERFTCVTGQGDYTLATDIRQKNIDLVMVGAWRYRSLDDDAVTPYQNAFSFDDVSHKLTLWPAPYAALQGFLRYRRIGTLVYTSSNLTAEPEAPEEYHWSYVHALVSYLAAAQDDAVKAANYEAAYKAAWNLAAQNYQAGEGK